MTNLCIGFALLFILSLCWLIYKLLSAPLGYEDDSGFHYGKKEK